MRNGTQKSMALVFRRRQRSDNIPQHLINGFRSFEYSGDIRIKADHQQVLYNLTRKAVRLCFTDS